MNAPEPRHPDHRHPSREAAHPVASIFLRRWSPRAFDASSLPASDLHILLEAARWAPSAYNIQPWRFIHARREDGCWARWLGLLDPFNAAWARHASALVFLVSDRLMPARDDGPRQPSSTHRFDAGAAWAQLALQATALGYQAHAMAGIDVAAVRAALEVPAHYQVEIAIAIGRPASPRMLSPELRAREVPSGRLPLEQIAFAGRFGAPDSGASS
ncbi:nitroreductase [Nitrogeniibacter mangrovi]|uniref:Nitroreductase n=1 Tax=Nitrogeniibacter mangrovi TaxID=2016596 RepID=A0A6C1B462_9RHOO|nr:nitroreductase family protein [Nitrogeniibacter mangrovi]QID18472.1 nitroreductase [Nitrogeniibacter mangrovi]